MHSGYYRFPTIQGDTIVFASEDDLWAVSSDGGVARRLTSSLSEASRPTLSPDGTWLAFAAREEGHNELYVMPASGGEPVRLSYFGAITRPVGWTPDGARIVFVTNHGQPFPHILRVYSIAPTGGDIEEIAVGPASSISFGPRGACVIGRNTADPARWKRYRGGTAGDLWVDADGSGAFRRLLTVRGNLASPMWVDDRIYFLSDHEGFGKLYSARPDGEDLRRHTDHERFYARNPSSDGQRVVYHAGADLYLFDPASGSSRLVDVEYPSPRTQRSRRFVDGGRYLQSYSLHPQGHSVALTMRGKPITMGSFSGPVVQHGELHGVRYRLTRYLGDGRRIVAIADHGGEECLVVIDTESAESEDRYEGLDIGRAVEMVVSPVGDRVAISNQRNETLVVDLAARTLRQIDRSVTLHSSAIAWSPDGRWLAFNRADGPETSYLMIADVESGERHQVTEPLLEDRNPAFDPEGKYLYFISHREFNPVYDNLHFDLGFPRGVRPYLVTLRKDTPNPFLPKPKAPTESPERLAIESLVEEVKKSEEKETRSEKVVTVEIDFDGITRRIVPFPVREGRYSQIVGVKGKAIYVDNPIEGTLDGSFGEAHKPSGSIGFYDFELGKEQSVVGGVDAIDISRDGSTLIYRAGDRLRVLATRGRIDVKESDGPGQESGWLDLSRPRIPVVPGAEWRQMFREAWRLQRDFFWTEGMLGIDWDSVYTTYAPLVERIGTRAELSDLIWEMQGELGTSHAYESGGDYRPSPNYLQGFLGADFALDESGEWIVRRIVRGDAWSDRFGSPLESPGVTIAEGDAIVAINGRRLSRERHPNELLVNTARTEIQLAFRPKGTSATRTVTLKTLASEQPARYREWVENNRRIVHEATGGKVGYVHVPNMGPFGYSEFHRGFLSEVGRGSLIVDVRFNGGGHVSQLLLEKLARRVLGYNLARYTVPTPYPDYALSGALVAITNENAGSDGDIFSHGFKMMKLGPLVGKRTWGGVVGIWPRNPLVDGSVTTQPEFSFWFEDVKWGVENYGTDPDIDVDIRPQDYVAGRDTQLERAIEEIKNLLARNGRAIPEFAERPTLAPTGLPVRN
jgi:tricorn protease